jgi:ABC-type transport system substrate-binding protein
MNRYSRTLLIGLIVAAALAACSSGASSSGIPAVSGSSEPAVSGSSEPAASATQTSEGGQVTVVATWTGPAAGAVIDVALDTHSVDLDALVLADATLRNDRGETLTARPWAAPKGGHHREGALTFDGNAPEFFAGARWMELVLVGVGDLPERTLRWEVGS